MKIIGIPNKSHYTHRTKKTKLKVCNATNTPFHNGIYKKKREHKYRKMWTSMKQVEKNKKKLDQYLSPLKNK